MKQRLVSVAPAGWQRVQASYSVGDAQSWR